MKNESIVFYVIVALSAALVLLSMFTLNLIIIALASSLLFASVIVYKLWYVIDAAIFKHTNLVQVFGGFELSGDRSSAVRKVSGAISATTVCALQVRGKGSVEKENIENIIAHINYPFKFVMQAERLNMDKLLDKLQTKRGIKEIELSRLDQSSSRHLPAVNRLKREIEVLDHDLESIGSGEVPLRIAYYVMTTAVSESKFDAEERSKAQIRELASQFDAILASKSELVHGNELLHLLEVDSTMVLE